MKQPATAGTRKKPAGETIAAPAFFVPEVRMLPLSSLTPAKYNPREIDEDNLKRLEGSMREHGLVDPLVINTRFGNRIIGGHQRYKVAKRLKLTEVQCVLLDLDEAKEKALNIVLNNPQAQGRYSPELLSKMVRELNETEFPLPAATGFTVDELEQLREYEKGDRLDFLLGSHGDVNEPKAPSNGELLDRLKVTLGEPRAVVAMHERWQLGHSLLVVADPVWEVKVWKKYLADDTVLCPYPGPYVPLTSNAAKHKLLLLQPDLYIAALTIDYFESVRGKGTAKKVVK